jgi:hypothetical protein
VSFGRGLADLPTPALRQLLAALHAGRLSCPIDHPALLRAGLPALVDRVEHLQGLDARGAHAVLVAVLAERQAAEARDAKKRAPG